MPDVLIPLKPLSALHLDVCPEGEPLPTVLPGPLCMLASTWFQPIGQKEALQRSGNPNLMMVLVMSFGTSVISVFMQLIPRVLQYSMLVSLHSVPGKCI